MVKHIVMWDLKNEFDGKNKSELRKELKNKLESLESKIDEIISLEVGINQSGSDAACDVVLYSEFDSMDALKAYQDHPEHVKIAEFVSNIRTSRHVVDYETD